MHHDILHSIFAHFQKNESWLSGNFPLSRWTTSWSGQRSGRNSIIFERKNNITNKKQHLWIFLSNNCQEFIFPTTKLFLIHNNKTKSGTRILLEPLVTLNSISSCTFLVNTTSWLTWSFYLQPTSWKISPTFIRGSKGTIMFIIKSLFTNCKVMFFF